MSVVKRSIVALLAVGVVAMAGASPAAAHVGSPDTWFEGNAGPYPIRVVVRAPGVVPGLAEIGVRVLSGVPQSVTVRPFIWNAGPEGAPPPDVARPVPGDPQLHTVNLWFMAASSYGVHVTVSGDQGDGTAIVPVQAMATRTLPMDPKLGWLLAALAAFLFVGLVTSVGAAVSESSLPPGQQPDAPRRKRARIAMAVSALVIAIALVGGWSWWNDVARAYTDNLYRPFAASASVVDSLAAPWLRLSIDDPRWRGREWTPLISDHGKLMHLFLVRDDDQATIAHLHPIARDSIHFDSRLPALPAGRYRVYADIVHESGFAQTMTASVELPAAPAVEAPSAPSDPDDSWFTIGAQSRVASESRFVLEDGATLVWERGNDPIVEREDYPLRFRVTAANGSPAHLEPYLGMIGHAMVTRDDGSVFAHLHPIGTVSMASQMALAMRTPADTVAGSLGRRISQGDHSGHGLAMAAGTRSNEFTIPYGFPTSGRYRIWVQVKIDGAVRTAAFDADVALAPLSSRG